MVTNARPVWYRSKAPADREDWGFYGLIAEEMAEVDPRLVTFGYQDHHYELVEVPDVRGEPHATLLGIDGNPLVIRIETTRTERRLKPDAEKVPDGVAYDRLTVMLLDVVRRQGERIAALEERLAAVENA